MLESTYHPDRNTVTLYRDIFLVILGSVHIIVTIIVRLLDGHWYTFLHKARRCDLPSYLCSLYVDIPFLEYTLS